MEKGWQLLLLITVLREGGKWRLFVFLLVDGWLAVGSLPDYPITFSWYTWSLERLKCLAAHADPQPALYTCVYVSKLRKELICYQINATLSCPGLVSSLPPLCLFVKFPGKHSDSHKLLFTLKAIFVFLQVALFAAGWWKSKKERHYDWSNSSSYYDGLFTEPCWGWGELIIWWAKQIKMRVWDAWVAP